VADFGTHFLAELQEWAWMMHCFLPFLAFHSGNSTFSNPKVTFLFELRIWRRETLTFEYQEKHHALLNFLN